jgi:hypothetical protein
VPTQGHPELNLPEQDEYFTVPGDLYAVLQSRLNPVARVSLSFASRLGPSDRSAAF